ncbi:hypothetical protein [Rhizobium leguminosarum]|uniref:Uncharacterized protein n=1 Tax=Rhizobium leguminosarum TaxID=384 RepID=A0A2Z4YW73_RHILE|nr:hypothetical protein [Rhizobium leguminosarum]AXA44805.1 hypothetical protein DLJ82_6835 [Rhizobium leguminosarum]
MSGQPNAQTALETISVWDNDPTDGRITTVAKPDPSQPPLKFLFLRAVPPVDNVPGTDGFRFWSIAEALRRCADFWTPKVVAQRWQRGPVLEVYDDVGEDLQADYDRQSLGFYHRTTPNGILYSGASPDIVCHELGHAVLDAMKSDLWSAGVPEIDAFHESFGDISAILSALQLPSLRTAILQETLGQLYCKSRLSRVAEQFGIALRAEDAEAAEIDCLRNARNDFTYSSIVDLPAHIAAEEVSSNPHSFSRIFTGAVFEVFCEILVNDAADGSSPTELELLDTSKRVRDIVAGGVLRSTLVTAYFAEIAFRMVQESAFIKPEYAEILLDVFERRLILSNETAAAILAMRTASGTIDDGGDGGPDTEQAVVAVNASEYGLDKPILVQTASREANFIARNGTPSGRSLEPMSVETAASIYVANLFTSGQLDADVVPVDRPLLRGPQSAKSHYISSEQGRLVLRRRLFHCGHRMCDCAPYENALTSSSDYPKTKSMNRGAEL